MTDRISLPRPRLRAAFSAEGPWTIDFGGVVATVTINPEDRSAHPSCRYDWSLERAGEVLDRGYCYTRPPTAELASAGASVPMLVPRSVFLKLWCRAAPAVLPPPTEVISCDEVEAIAARVETVDVGEAAKILRELLRRRTGFSWSVRRGRGTGAETLLVSAAKARRANGRMTEHDAALLAALTGESMINPTNGARVLDTKGARASVVRSIAGSAPRLRLVVS